MKFHFNKAVNMRWRGYDLSGDAGTIFRIEDGLRTLALAELNRTGNSSQQDLTLIEDTADEIANSGTGLGSVTSVSGTPVSGQIIVATSSISATWQSAAASGLSKGSFPTLIETLPFSAAGGASATFSLVGTPQAGDVLIMAALSAQFGVTSVTGGGCTHWHTLGVSGTPGGSECPLALWIGVVDTTPSKDVVVTWQGSNANVAALQNWRGLTGGVEATYGTPGPSLNTWLGATLGCLLATVGIAFNYTRGTQPAELTGLLTSDTTTSSNGAGALSHQNLSAAKLFGPVFPAPSAEGGLIFATLY